MKKSGGIFCYLRGRKQRSGFTLIEILIDALIISMVTTAVLASYSLALKSADSARAKIAAVALANEKIEEMRNMPYDSLGTDTGNPVGAIVSRQTISRQGINFDTRISIATVNDPYDGTDPPTDLYVYDYKRIEVTVSKLSQTKILAKLSSFVAAKAAETATNTGILRVCVRQTNTEFVPEALVDVTHPTNGTNFQDLVTPINDCLLVPLLQPGDSYTVTANKTGYTTASTTFSISVQQVTPVTLFIDPSGKMAIKVIDNNNNPMVSFPIQVTGGASGYNQNNTTDVSGIVALENLPPDSYSVFELSADFEYQKTMLGNPPVDIVQPIQLASGDELGITIVVAAGAGSCQGGGAPNCGNGDPNPCDGTYKLIDLTNAPVTSDPLPEQATLVIDEDPNTIWGDFTEQPNKLLVEKEMHVKKIVLDNFTPEINISVSDDQINWTPVASISPGSNEYVFAEAVESRYWKITLGSIDPTAEQGTVKHLGGIRFYKPCGNN
ncbi:MAG: type II secretion system protein [Patescibacteria group bacterium]|jgi:type II secretory pathway pseudopilin PulG